MRLIRADRDLEGVHISVGLTNFSFGVPKQIRDGLENAYVTLAIEAGLDTVPGRRNTGGGRVSAVGEDHGAVQVVAQLRAPDRNLRHGAIGRSPSADPHAHDG